jgi:hypothetical protein
VNPLCAAPTLPKTPLLRRQSSQRLISLHLRVGESPPTQPPFLPQVPPSPTFRFRDAITASRGSMPAPLTLLLGLQWPPIYGDPSLTSLHFNFNFTRVRAHHLPVLYLPFWCIEYRYYWQYYTLFNPLSLADASGTKCETS